MRKCENLVDLEKCEKNVLFLDIVAVDTAENELRKGLEPPNPLGGIDGRTTNGP